MVQGSIIKENYQPSTYQGDAPAPLSKVKDELPWQRLAKQEQHLQEQFEEKMKISDEKREEGGTSLVGKASDIVSRVTNTVGHGLHQLTREAIEKIETLQTTRLKQRFPVDKDELLLYEYSCIIFSGDTPCEGYLYITTDHVGFFSDTFCSNFKMKLWIPLEEVVSVQRGLALTKKDGKNVFIQLVQSEDVNADAILIYSKNNEVHKFYKFGAAHDPISSYFDHAWNVLDHAWRDSTEELRESKKVSQHNPWKSEKDKKDSKEKDQESKKHKDSKHKEKDSKSEKGSKDKSPKQNDNEKEGEDESPKEKDSKDKSPKHKDSQEKDSKDKSSKSKKSKDKSPKERDSKDNSPKDKSPKEKESQKDKDSKDKESKDKSPKDKESKDKSPKDKESKDKSPKDKESKDKSPKEKESQKDKDSKHKESKDKSPKDKESKDKSQKDKESQKESKNKSSDSKGSKAESSREEGHKSDSKTSGAAFYPVTTGLGYPASGSSSTSGEVAGVPPSSEAYHISGYGKP